jgi:SSS family solute:Na+ symporter
MVSESFGLGKDALAGFNQLFKQAPDHFNMIFSKPAEGAPAKEISNYTSLPGLAMLAAGMWVANLNYWGCNQYITQRALGASLPTARAGIFFAAFLKLLMPLLVVLPGIAAYVLHQNGQLQQEMNSGGAFRPDNAYAAVLGFLPVGLKGLAMAALTAAIVASLAGKANSISTIYTLDIYKKYFNREASEQKLVWTGRIVIVIAMILALVMTWNDTLGIGGEGGFQFIQKYTGYISPAIFPVFLLGFFWKRTTSAAAITGILGGVVLSFLFDNYLPQWFGHDTLLYTAYPNADGKYEIPFLISMGWVFFFTTVMMVIVSLAGKRDAAHGLEVEKSMFRLTSKQLVSVLILLGLIVALYIRFW